MKCIDFQNEFEEQNALSEKATLHLENCEDCQNFSYQQNRVWEMLGGLGQVNAPKNFNFGVKARIADAKSGDSQTQTGFFPAFRFVMPIGFVIVFLSFVALSGLYFVGTQENPIASEKIPSTTPVVIEDSPNTFATEDEVAKETYVVEENINESPAKSSETIAQKTAPKVVVNKDKETSGSRDYVLDTVPKVIKQPENEEGGGSRVLTAESSNPIIQPEFDTNKNVKTPVNPTQGGKIDVKEILELSGIMTDSENEKLKVKSVRKNSIAESSGVMVGDVIEAINGKKITEVTFDEKTINIETITVLRKGETKVIALKTKK